MGHSLGSFSARPLAPCGASHLNTPPSAVRWWVTAACRCPEECSGLSVGYCQASKELPARSCLLCEGIPGKGETSRGTSPDDESGYRTMERVLADRVAIAASDHGHHIPRTSLEPRHPVRRGSVVGHVIAGAGKLRTVDALEEDAGEVEPTQFPAFPRSRLHYTGLTLSSRDKQRSSPGTFPSFPPRVLSAVLHSIHPVNSGDS